MGAFKGKWVHFRKKMGSILTNGSKTIDFCHVLW